MLEFELPETGITAKEWREEDERHACASCHHCKDGGSFIGFYCNEIEAFLSDAGAPVTRVTIDTSGICNGYDLNPKQFFENEWEYPHGFDASELYTNPDEKRHEEREHEHAMA